MPITKDLPLINAHYRASYPNTYEDSLLDGVGYIVNNTVVCSVLWERDNGQLLVHIAVDVVTREFISYAMKEVFDGNAVDKVVFSIENENKKAQQGAIALGATLTNSNNYRSNYTLKRSDIERKLSWVLKK